MTPAKWPPIPKTVVTIQGTVPVMLVAGLKDEDGEEAWGLWCRRHRTIEIELTLPPPMQWSAYFHELMHAALDDSGLANLLTDTQQEALCDASASARIRELFG